MASEPGELVTNWETGCDSLSLINNFVLGKVEEGCRGKEERYTGGKFSASFVRNGDVEI